MNAKDIQNKIKGLYADVDPDNLLKTDTYYINNAMSSDRMRSYNLKKVEQYKYIFRTPGSDLLDFYDKMWQKYTRTNKSPIPPSAVYRIRYQETYEKGKKMQKLWDIIGEYTDISRLSECFPKDAINRHCKWLTKEKSKQYTFNIQLDLRKFILENYNIKDKALLISPTGKGIKETIFWFGDIAGCSIIVQDTTKQ